MAAMIGPFAHVRVGLVHRGSRLARRYLRRATERVDIEIVHQNHRRDALQALRVVEAEEGTTDPKVKKMCDEYAREVLGTRKYAPWLYLYSAVRGSFNEGWIPDNYYGSIVSPRINGRVRVSGMKSFTKKIFDSEAIPDIGYVIDGKVYAKGYELIGEHELKGRIYESTNRVFYKSDGSGRGRGVRVIDSADFNFDLIKDYPNGVFQTPICQHDFFDEITSSSTATVRITTVKESDGRVQVRAAYLRVGREGEMFVKSESHLRIHVDRNTGSLGDCAYMPDWSRTEKHPDSAFTFSGKTIPNFSDAAALCKELHERCPHLSCIGWDVCIDKSGEVKIMEWNAGHNDIKFSEASSGPCFSGLGWENLWKFPVPR